MKEKYYENNSEEYIAQSMKFDMTAFNRYLLKELNEQKDLKILDLGFGSGRDMLFLKEKGFNVEGIDYCEDFVKRMKQMDFTVYREKFPSLDSLPGNYDFIYSVGVLMHLNKEDRIQLFKNLKDKLTDNGLLVFSYNELDRTNDPERLFFKLNELEIDNEVNLKIINKEIIMDSRGINWITVTYQK